MKEIPSFITHYSRGEPFRTMSSVPRDQWLEVVAQLNETNAWGLGRFTDAEYMERRLRVEERLRSGFIAAGGRPELQHPIYFFLGRNERFEQHPANKPYI